MSSETKTFNLATWLTISRFLLVPVFIYYFLTDEFGIAVIVLIVASITDVTDGLLARKFNMGTKLGQVLDPLADKFLMLISFLVLAAKGTLPFWLALIVIGRDFYIVFGCMYLYYVKKANLKISPSKLSKRTTFAQFLLLTFSFIKVYLVVTFPEMQNIYATLVFQIQYALVYITCILTLVTFVQYTQQGLIFLHGEKRND